MSGFVLVLLENCERMEDNGVQMKSFQAQVIPDGVSLDRSIECGK
jgi:hypothetical protein